MTIVPRIEEIVKRYFETYFQGIESFYLKNFLIIIQGFPSKGNTSISAIASDETYGVAHKPLTRFMRSYEAFWKTLKNTML